ncbi:O-methyltransferase [Bradyrhizobium sp. SSBR45G]|uniref:protein-L-isoaspartate O-methyltransferase family protein n=1 Tax=unclassified Bradyrhizobium TaxID=2631580 RepID=UPI0023428D40|nr:MULTISPECIES: methyltransferase domain-containing protein [unclassified Bradyrhizobium]GLH81243.1 O-methyltransferase [Bradyrhizobium sp. SSBR45G]GLH88737.1 O-methyltransferase [Bradyrhizobium sp. SSBR45R]
MDPSEKYRSFYASLICASAKHDDARIEEAFRAVRREPFAGPGPWWMTIGGHPYVQTPDDDPAFLYQNLLLALDHERGINIGQPAAHALWLGACAIRPADTVVQIGVGSGYYTAILAHLVGPRGRVCGYEIDEAMAVRARENLKDLSHVELRMQSGVEAELPAADVIYVCAGAAKPSRSWLNSLRPGGRLLFPLAPQGVFGGMLLITRPGTGPAWPATFVSRAAFIGCVGLQDEEGGRRLSEAFSGAWDAVRSLHLDGPPDDSCWFAGDDWWLSTQEVAEPGTD